MIIREYIGQYKEKFGKLPTEVVIAPAAAVVLGIKQELIVSCLSIPVITRNIEDEEVNVTNPEKLCLFLQEGAVRATSLTGQL